jgi:signal transduction histidine kinase
MKCRRSSDEMSNEHLVSRLRLLVADLLTSQDMECRRIAHEIHNHLNQQLALLMLDLGSLTALVPKSHDSARAHLEAIHSRSNEISEAVHALAYQLHPSALEDLGLAVGLAAYAREFSRRLGLEVSLRCRKLPHQIPQDISTCLYRVAVESLDNVGRHAHASTVATTLTGRGSFLRLSIKDNGVGFDIGLLPKVKRGCGILKMEERMRLIRGTLAVKSERGAGTQIVALAPLAPEA